MATVSSELPRTDTLSFWVMDHDGVLPIPNALADPICARGDGTKASRRCSTGRFGDSVRWRKFAVVLPDCDEQSAQVVGDRLRACISATPDTVGNSTYVDIVASAGVATAHLHTVISLL